jgi:zinc resistance-associated protein
MMTGFRKSWLLMLTLVLSLGIAGAAWAGPQGMGMGGGCGMMGPEMGMGPGMGMGHGKGMGKGMGCMQMTPDQAAKAFDLHHKFMNDTAEVRKQMMVKKAELGELWRAKDPDKAKIAAKQKEINALRDQFQEKAISFKVDMKQQCPMMGGDKGPGAGPMVPPAPEGGKK